MVTEKFENFKKLLIFISGAAATLFLIALAEAAARWKIIGAQPAYVNIDGWYGIWFILEIASLAAGLALLFSPRWKEVPSRLRLNPILAAFGIAWLLLLALALKLSLNLSSPFHFVVAGLGCALLVAALITYTRTHRAEELFP